MGASSRAKEKDRTTRDADETMERKIAQASRLVSVAPDFRVIHTDEAYNLNIRSKSPRRETGPLLN
jgi:hypothetical protein